MNVTPAINIVDVFKCLADDTRLSIVRKLATDKCEVKSSEIITSCSTFHQLSQPAMSHHFQKLVAAGVVSERKVGVEKLYELNTDLLKHIGINVEKI